MMLTVSVLCSLSSGCSGSANWVHQWEWVLGSKTKVRKEYNRKAVSKSIPMAVTYFAQTLQVFFQPISNAVRTVPIQGICWKQLETSLQAAGRYLANIGFRVYRVSFSSVSDRLARKIVRIVRT